MAEVLEIVSSPWHVLSALLVLLVGAIISVISASRFCTRSRRALILYAWHTMFSMVYLWYSVSYGSDSLDYFLSAVEFSWEFSPGTQFVNFLTGILINGLNLSILGSFLVFNIFGVVGLLAFDGSLRVATRQKPRYLQHLATLIVFLPSVSFWSSAIGKDALSFMAMGLALWAALALNSNWRLMAFSVTVMFLVRPHIAAVMLLALSFAILTNRNSRFILKIFLLMMMAAVVVVMQPFVINYAGINENFNAAALSDYVEQRQGYNMEGGGGIDIASMSFPMQLFTYMFRPMLFEATTIFALAAAIDNLILMCLFVLGGWAMLGGGKSNTGESRAFMWAYALLVWIVLALTTSNMGIALRQKWMLAPMLIFLAVSVVSIKKHKKLRSDTIYSDAPVYVKNAVHKDTR